MLAVVAILLTGSMSVSCTAASDQSRTFIPGRFERQADNLKYLLDINRQKYLEKFQESRLVGTRSKPARPIVEEEPRRQSGSSGGLLPRPRLEYKNRLDQILEARKRQKSRPAEERSSQFRSSTRNRISSNRSSGRDFRGGYTRQSSRQSNRDGYNRYDSATCEDLRSENQLLRQMLESQEVEEARRSSSVKGDGLNVLLNLVNKQDGKDDHMTGLVNLVDNKPEDTPLAIPAIPQISVVQAEPVLTTILHTNSIDTTVTEEVTKEIEILFHGKKLTTEIVEEQIKIVPTVHISTEIIEITPTPVIQQLNIQQQQPTISSLGLLGNIQQPTLSSLGLLGNIQSQPNSFNLIQTSENSELDSFQSLQDILKKIRERAQNAATADENVVLPSQVVRSVPEIEPSNQGSVTVEETAAVNNEPSVITLYLSGDKPGEFTTSLSTVSPTPEGERRKRDIHPTKVNLEFIDATLPPDFYLLQEELLGSSGQVVLGSYCERNTVTVTQTVTVC